MNKPASVPLRVATAAMATLLLLTLGLFIFHGARTIGFPYPLDYGEGPLLDQALRLAQAEMLQQIQSNYRASHRFGHTVVYLPREN